MTLSFTRDLSFILPDTLQGIQRYERIYAALQKNRSWYDECYKELQRLFFKMTELGASDMDIGGKRANDQVWFRVKGNKYPCDELPHYTNDETASLLISAINAEQKNALFLQKNIDVAISIDIGAEQPSRFRSDIFFEQSSLAANFRMINQKLFDLKDLRIPPPIHERLDLEYEKTGLILITGITGSGKSSTLDSIIDMNNRKNKGSMIIIGNPIEYIHQSKKCLISHREIGTDVLSFQKGTIEALRQDPDIVVVGEMRDPSTISTVLEVTDSGHKVFSTLHTSSAVESIHRIIAEFPPDEQVRVRFRLADTLKVVISQKLVPSRSGGLTLAKEILSVGPSEQAAIRNGNVNELFQMLTEGRRRGMCTMQQDLLSLVKRGVITKETALNYANNRKVMKQLLGTY
ncbi:MAG: Flp pilus assembly complex ATPase component TadA [Candidatus Cloacimonetes bacterium]|nr:Flp pilus assembly complex ATPase component TadA [Candidatus Cloacimonadota bacterium]